MPHAIRADEVCPACEQSAGEDSRMVRCKACRNAFHQVCVMHNPLLMPDDDFECGSENCEAPVPFQLPLLYSTSMEPSPSPPPSMRAARFFCESLLFPELMAVSCGAFAGPSFGRASRPPRYKIEDLADSPLGQYLTARSRSAVASPKDLIIKVVSDKDMYKPIPDGPNASPLDSSASPGRGQAWCSYRSKCILGFRRFPATGSQVVFLGMYVHEYGRQSQGPNANAGRVFLECLDSTPLYSEERPGERQEVLTNIMLAYFEFITAQGFEFAHVRVPPPTDDKGYIFASRSVNVRLRAAMHLAHWFKRLLQMAKSQGIIEDFSASPSCATINFPPSLLEPAQLASDIAFRYATGQSADGFGGGAGGADGDGAGSMPKAASLKDRFFVINLAHTDVGRGAGQSGVNLPHGLNPEKVQRWASHVLLPSYIAGDRLDLVSLLQREGLHFHSLAHNNYSTMMLVHHLMEEQRLMVSERRQQQRAGDRLAEGAADGDGSYSGHVQYAQHHHLAPAHPYHRMQEQRVEMRMTAGYAGGAVMGPHDGFTGQWGVNWQQPTSRAAHHGVSPCSPILRCSWC